MIKYKSNWGNLNIYDWLIDWHLFKSKDIKIDDVNWVETGNELDFTDSIRRLEESIGIR